MAIEKPKQAVDRMTVELSAAHVIGPRSAFDLRAVAQLVAAVLLGFFLVAFLLAFLPWLLATGMTSAVEGLMRQLGFAQFTAENIVTGCWSSPSGCCRSPSS